MSEPTAGNGDARGAAPSWSEPLALAALWGPFFWKLSPAWSASVEQAHGWAVPLLAAYFWRERRGACGAGGEAEAGVDAGAVAVRSGLAEAGSVGWRRGDAAAWSALVAGVVALALALTVLEANPLWPAAQWAGYAAAALATLALVAFDGGRATARRVWFPIFFVSTALVWPTAATLRLQAVLVGMNTHLAAAVVSAAGYPAVVTGNVIEVARGFVGVDEACSGVRSLQAAWMAGWFFGELGALTAARRLGLVGAALATAVAGNFLRTTTLTWLAAAGGPEASTRWHDTAGFAEMAVVIAGVMLWAWWLGRGGRGAAGKPLERAEELRPTVTGARASAAWWLAIGGGVLAAATPEIWYRAHEARAGVVRTQWELRRPDASWRDVAWPEATTQLLRASAQEGFRHAEAAGVPEATALLVRWDGDVASAVFAEQHGPTVCLPAAGARMTSVATPAVVAVDGVPIEFSVGRFEAEGREQFVLFCQWDAWLARSRAPSHATLADVTGWRWSRVREGRRRGDAAYVVFVVSEPSEAAARAWLAAWAPRLLRKR